MGKINRLSDQEKENRKEVLSAYRLWCNKTGQHSSPLKYAQSSGTNHAYLISCLKWEYSITSKRVIAKGGFAKIEKKETSIPPDCEPVRILFKSCAIEVTPHSSKAALSMVLSALEETHVF